MEVETGSRTIRFILNGEGYSISSNPVSRTSDVLREELGLTGTKVGCDAGDCGACTILIDGEQRFACLTAAGQLEGHDVQTVEGLAKDGALSLLQQAFHRYGAA
ncbi:MAG TPA: 2Fe-2S iron-sulfur cluster-binding protein, partial [SAR324 cluster bacterium]|nr:2Fe-2S iron-sulfur cluster-binding protein [SAR324 cluster bacterium]